MRVSKPLFPKLVPAAIRVLVHGRRRELMCELGGGPTVGPLKVTSGTLRREPVGVLVEATENTFYRPQVRRLRRGGGTQ